jgi:dihydroorotate dehydrogenase electron transfer subunit
MDGMLANRPVSLVARESLGGAYAVLTFLHPEAAQHARAGQFVMIKAGTSPEPPLRRPFSILAVDPARETFSLFVKGVGPGSRALLAMAVGDPALCLAPLGRPFTPPPEGTEALMVAGGYGIAPFLLFSRELVRLGLRGRVFYGGRTEADLQLRDRFGPLGVPLVAATEDGSVGRKGRVTVPLEEHLERESGALRLYGCGPDAMLHAVARLAAERGLPAEISLDPWMGCGVGTCLSCVIRVQRAGEGKPKYRCACTEGPVFEASTVVWPGESESRAGREGRSAETPA